MSDTILYINTPTYTGGAEISLLTLMRHLDPARYVPLLVTSGEGQLAEAARGYGIETLIQAFPWLSRRKPWEYFRSFYELVKTVARGKIVLIHTNCPGAAQQVKRVSKWMGVPYVAHVRDSRHAWSTPQAASFLQGAKGVLANSKAIAQHFIDLGVPESRIKVVYNPVNIASYSQPIDSIEKMRFRAFFGIPDEALLIGVVGQVQEIKGQEDLVRAAPSILRRFPGTHFLIVGAAFDEEAQKYERRLKQLILELHLDKYFHLVGFQKDVGAVMRSLDMLVVPSRQESFGRVVVEGMAAGCPVIGTNVGGIPEIIENDINGLLVQPRNPAEIAEAAIALVDNTDLRRRFIEQGRVTVERFNIAAHVNEVQSLYDSLLNISREGK